VCLSGNDGDNMQNLFTTMFEVNCISWWFQKASQDIFRHLLAFLQTEYPCEAGQQRPNTEDK